MEKKVLVETSARHVHVTREALDILFGEGYELTVKKELSQPGQFASNERVAVVGSKGSFPAVSILGPVRPENQVELSLTDARSIGVTAPVRESGDIAGSGACKLVGPKGEVELECGVIAAKRHIHATPEDAEKYGIKDEQLMYIYSRRGKVITRAKVDPRCFPGNVYMTYQWWVGKCNDLTIDHVDENSHTPEDKYCAVNLEAIPDQVWAEKHLNEVYTDLKKYLADTAAPQYAGLK